MPATELELMLGAAAWRLQAGAEDPALTTDALREMARDGAMLLEQLRTELAKTRLARGQAGDRQARHKAGRDGLTTLPDRNGCAGHLHGALSVRPSIGIAMCPTDGDNATALLQRADAAMFRAKRQQCGLAFFDASADQRGRLPDVAMAGTSGGRLGGR